MAEDYPTLLHRWFEEVWNKGREEAVDEMLAEDGIAHGLSDAAGETVRGTEAFKVLHRAFRNAFPNIHIEIEEIVTEGDKIAAVCRVTATHKGKGLGVLPTNKPVEFTGLTIVKVKDGKIVEAWNQFDFMKMYTQIGVLKLNLQ